MKQLLSIVLLTSLCIADKIERRKQMKHGHDTASHTHSKHHLHHEYNAYDSNSDDVVSSSAHVVVSKEGPPPSPQEYTISKLEEGVVCASRGDQTWAKWKKYDLDGICSRLQYYGEIEGRCETDCDLLCPQGFYEVAKEECTASNAHHHHSVLSGMGGGYYRLCVGRYKCTESSYNYWVNMSWWQFLLWEVLIVILGCCFFGLAVGCCLRCLNRSNNRARPPPARQVANVSNRNNANAARRNDARSGSSDDNDQGGRNGGQYRNGHGGGGQRGGPLGNQRGGYGHGV
mmetsp:Transcript_70639/g.112246  ORF Transcript_70639/g.112246 Transcript_70639/m.112246 type:complete len:287 (+) Transcript_70639:207-1067(+)